MELPLFQVDAFSGEPFRGNPAAVCLLPRWIDERLMQAIAAENNLSETAFLVGGEGRYGLRWFTPAVEVELCGHATLASAHVLFAGVERARSRLAFETRSGTLHVEREGGWLVLDLPAQRPEPCEPPAGLEAALGAELRATARARYFLALLADEDAVRALRPDLAALARLERPVIVTARGRDVDFVSRFFAPTVGVPEDPVTGSAHCILTPYWSERLGKDELTARQLSARGGELRCRLAGDRVRIAGQAVLYLEGRIEVPERLGDRGLEIGPRAV